MIVRPGHDGIQLITQPDHAHLARTIMEHCVPLAARPRRDAILHAIAEHDNGWAEEDAAPTVRASAMPLDDLEADYVFVRLGDLISFTFCTAWTDEQRFGGWTVQLSGTRVAVVPDAFGGADVPVEIRAREIRNPPFRSDAELRDALSEADTKSLRGEIVFY